MDHSVYRKSSDDKSGFGGWLVLFQISFYLVFVQFIVSLVRALADGSRNLPDAHYVNGLMYIVVPLLIICLILFYGRYIAFRWLYIAAIALNFLVLYMDYKDTPGQTVLLAVYAAVEALLIVYIYVSKRVKNTFF